MAPATGASRAPRAAETSGRRADVTARAGQHVSAGTRRARRRGATRAHGGARAGSGYRARVGTRVLLSCAPRAFPAIAAQARSLARGPTEKKRRESPRAGAPLRARLADALPPTLLSRPQRRARATGPIAEVGTRARRAFAAPPRRAREAPLPLPPHPPHPTPRSSFRPPFARLQRHARARRRTWAPARQPRPALARRAPARRTAS